MGIMEGMRLFGRSRTRAGDPRGESGGVEARCPELAEIGVDPAADLARGFTVTETGITVVGKDAHVTRE